MAPILTRVGQAFGFGSAPAAGGGGSEPIGASGGFLNEYESGGTKYRAHIFTQSGSFTVTSGDGECEYLVVAGGGAGCGTAPNGGGRGAGGAGGLRTNVPGVVDAGSNPLTNPAPFPISSTGGNGSGVYTITVGKGAYAQPASDGLKGEDSSFAAPANTPQNIVATGGGGGVEGPNNPGGSGGPNPTYWAGGSGGGSHTPFGYGVNGAGNTPPFTPPQGNPGGQGDGSGSSGGGGAGATGGASPETPGTMAGGVGVQVDISNAPGTAQAFGTPAPGSPGTGWYAGGGGGADYPNSAPEWGAGGYGGGGRGGGNGIDYMAGFGIENTGGGGGGGVQGTQGGGGGDGIVIVKYEIDTADAGTAKATGGLISFYNGKVIHTFNKSGTLTTNPTFNETIEYVLVGGGGGGGGNNTGGGMGAGAGAGGFNTGTAPFSTGNSAVTITVGAGGLSSFTSDGASSTPHSPNWTPLFHGQSSKIAAPADPTFNFGAGGGGAGAGGPGRNGWSGQPGDDSGTNQPQYTYGSGGGGASPGGNPGPQGDPAGASNNNPGGSAGPSGPPYCGSAGGGGAASPDPTASPAEVGAGQNTPQNSNASGGAGGLGVQLPATFRDPAGWLAYEGPGPSNWWVCGGGGGGTADGSYPTGGAGGGGAPDGNSWCGGGIGQLTFPAQSASEGVNLPGRQNSGGGGGGAGHNGLHRSGSGGPGVVLLAYPE